ncbi:MAG: cytochrome c [Neptuniibacter sp.]
MKLKKINLNSILVVGAFAVALAANASGVSNNEQTQRVEAQATGAHVAEAKTESATEYDLAIAKEGKDVYNTFCVRCHGPNMVNPGTITYDLRKFPHDEKDRFLNSVTNGKRQMPPWGHILTKEEINSIWDYVLTKGEI